MCLFYYKGGEQSGSYLTSPALSNINCPMNIIE